MTRNEMESIIETETRELPTIFDREIREVDGGYELHITSRDWVVVSITADRSPEQLKLEVEAAVRRVMFK